MEKLALSVQKRQYLSIYSPKRVKIEQKLQLMAYIKSYMGFRLPPKCLTLNDL